MNLTKIWGPVPGKSILAEPQLEYYVLAQLEKKYQK